MRAVGRAVGVHEDAVVGFCTVLLGKGFQALRFALQSARRRKWHRSLMAFWTFDEPWPNSAYGNVIDYYGLPKMAYWWVKQSMAMVDVSLEYYSLLALADGRTPLAYGVWVDSEHHAALPACCVALELFWLNGTLAAPLELLPLANGSLVEVSPLCVAFARWNAAMKLVVAVPFTHPYASSLMLLP